MPHADIVRLWLDRAKEARTVAGQMRDPDARRMMLKIAEDYQRLAERAKLVNGSMWLDAGAAAEPPRRRPRRPVPQAQEG
jgi:hypothetical protein